LYGALFVWALTSAVALAAYSARPTPSATLVAASPGSSHTEMPDAPLPASTDTAKVGAAPTKIVWEQTFEAAMQKARTEGKPIMVNFYTDWCGWCKELDRQVFPDKTVVAESANWVSIKINAEKRPDVAGAYGVTGYPTIVFAQSSGKPLDVLAGFAPPKDFVATMVAARAKLTK
jgi:thiol:disulfide interchange protein